MSDYAFRPNWASPPGETILAILHAKGVSLASFREEIGLHEVQASELISGLLPITPLLAKALARSVGSTTHFWLERQKQYQACLKALASAEPELTGWGDSFPVKKMVDSGWLPKPRSKGDTAFELLDYFDVGTVEEWKARYVTRLGMTHFRTSPAFENDVASTTAWIRRGELAAEAVSCRPWDKEGFLAGLRMIKGLTKDPDPKSFIPALIAECARYGVAVVVERCVGKCAASGATYMLGDGKALLMLSGRFLSDDQFWFSFFHEAGHLVLHGDKPHLDSINSSTPQKEEEANEFAEGIILEPESRDALLRFSINKFSIVRLAKRCNVAPGLIVGQLQHKGRLSPKLFNRFKRKFRADDFSLEIA